MWERRDIILGSENDIILGRDDERQKRELYRSKVKGEELKRVSERLSTTGSLHLPSVYLSDLTEEERGEGTIGQYLLVCLCCRATAYIVEILLWKYSSFQIIKFVFVSANVQFVKKKIRIWKISVQSLSTTLLCFGKQHNIVLPRA